MMTDYEKYLDSQAISANLRERLKVDDIVYIQNELYIHKAQVVKLSDKSAKLKMLEGNFKDKIKNYPYFKMAKEGDRVVLAWEAWRGINGRGGYRWEREAYEDLRIPVENIPKKAFLCEEDFLIVNKIYQDSYQQKISGISKPKVSLKN